MVEFRHDSAFEQSRCAVRSLSRGGKGVVVSMAQPCWRLGLAVGQMGLPSVVENIGDVGSGSRLAPGQWHHRRAPLTLRYRPRSAAERAELLGGDSDAAVPLAAELLVADGVSRLSVQGITFMHSSWDAPRSDDGYLERYGGVRFLSCTSAAAEETRRCYRNGSACAAGCCGAAALGGCALRMAEAAVSIRSGTDVEVSGCEFRQVGAWGLALTAGPLRVRAERNTFTDCSGGGIYVGNVNETATEGTTRRPTGVAVTDNVVEWVGQEFQGSSGIHLFSAVDSTISHNRLAHTPYTAITFVWPVPQSDSFNRNNSLIANDISDPSFWGRDGGAVHTLSTCTDCLLRGNHFHDQRHGSKCTYIDNGSSGYTITDHVIDRANASIWLYFQQGCGPSCPWAPVRRFGRLPGINTYAGCNSSANHAKCCCDVGHDNHAGPGLFVRDGTPNPFPIWNLTGKLVWLARDSPFPPEANRIIAAAGPRHLKSDDREVALFVCCDIAAGEWGRHLQAIRRHVSNLTTVIVSPYELSSNATLVNQGSHAQDALSAAAQMRAELNLRTTALVACSPSGIRRAIYDSAAAQALVRAAVTQAVRTGIDGYNLDAEFAGDQNATDGARFVAFLNLFADALHAVNRTLSVDVHGDGSRPFDFHVWGSAYKASKVDRIVTMATYTDAKRNFDKYFAEAVYQVGPAKIQPGMEPNAVLANPLDIGYIRSKNVSSIAVWGPTPGALAQAHWDSMGAFLQVPVHDV